MHLKPPSAVADGGSPQPVAPSEQQLPPPQQRVGLQEAVAAAEGGPSEAQQAQQDPEALLAAQRRAVQRLRQHMAAVAARRLEQQQAQQQHPLATGSGGLSEEQHALLLNQLGPQAWSEAQHLGPVLEVASDLLEKEVRLRPGVMKNSDKKYKMPRAVRGPCAAAATCPRVCLSPRRILGEP